jgi:hypothetical protein
MLGGSSAVERCCRNIVPSDQWQQYIAFARTSIVLSAAFVAHTLLHASRHILSVTPVRIKGKELNSQCLIESKEYWALVIGVSLQGDCNDTQYPTSMRKWLICDRR